MGAAHFQSIIWKSSPMQPSIASSQEPPTKSFTRLLQAVQLSLRFYSERKSWMTTTAPTIFLRSSGLRKSTNRGAPITKLCLFSRIYSSITSLARISFTRTTEESLLMRKREPYLLVVSPDATQTMSGRLSRRTALRFLVESSSMHWQWKAK